MTGLPAPPALNWTAASSTGEPIVAKAHPELTTAARGGEPRRAVVSCPRRRCAPALAKAPRTFRARALSHWVGSCPQRLGTIAKSTSRPLCHAQRGAGHPAPGPGIAGSRTGRVRAGLCRRSELPSSGSPWETDSGQGARRGPGGGASELSLEPQRAPGAQRPEGRSPPPTPTSLRLGGRPGLRPPAWRRCSAPRHPAGRASPPGAHSHRPRGCRTCRRSAARCSAPGLGRRGRRRTPAPGPRFPGRRGTSPGGAGSPRAPPAAAAPAAAPASTQPRSGGPRPAWSSAVSRRPEAPRARLEGGDVTGRPSAAPPRGWGRRAGEVGRARCAQGAPRPSNGRSAGRATPGRGSRGCWMPVATSPETSPVCP